MSNETLEFSLYIARGEPNGNRNTTVWVFSLSLSKSISQSTYSPLKPAFFSCFLFDLVNNFFYSPCQKTIELHLTSSAALDPGPAIPAHLTLLTPLLTLPCCFPLRSSLCQLHPGRKPLPLDLHFKSVFSSNLLKFFAARMAFPPYIRVDLGLIVNRHFCSLSIKLLKVRALYLGWHLKECYGVLGCFLFLSLPV